MIRARIKLTQEKLRYSGIFMALDIYNYIGLELQ